MIYKNVLEFEKEIKSVKIEQEKLQKEEQKNFRLETGETFKQITLFEETIVNNGKNETSPAKYGAWFVSEKNAIFLTPGDIQDLVDNKKIVIINN